MLGYLEYLKIPTTIAVGVVIVFFIMQIIGEFLEFKGRVVPEFLKIRKYFARKKQERVMRRRLPETLSNIQSTIDDFLSHYSKDNMQKRDNWIENVNNKLEDNDKAIKALVEKMDKNNKDTLSLLIDSKRKTIIDFAAYVTNESNPVTREQFNRIFKLYDEYEEIIKENHLTNGEVKIAIRIIRESYETHMRNHTFIEDIRGYDIHA